MIRSLVTVAVAAVLLGVAPAAPAQLLQIDHDFTAFDGMVSDRFTWLDASGQPRVAVLAHNDGQVGPGGTRGGELRQFQYQLPGPVTRTVNASGAGDGGFGYVVSHPTDTAACLGLIDSSSLGHFTTGTFTRVFEGRHHAIFRFQQNYPRDCTKNPPAVAYSIPVTIDWVFETGRDHPLWAVTWDLMGGGIPADALEDDSRGPYGVLQFDGGAGQAIRGVAWGDRYKFSASDPAGVKYNSAWTWDTPNTIPYVKLWSVGVDATMGSVLTQTIDQQDAGGYFGTDRWNTTSAAGPACLANFEGPGLPAHLMPCSFNWPYQSINYEMGVAGGGDDNSPAFNGKLAWGTNFGFLGQTGYLRHGSTSLGGPLPDLLLPGYPKKSYSVFVVLDRDSVDPVGGQVAQMKTVQVTTLTAGIGSVVMNGPAGVNRTDTVGYAPAGWNHVYGAWAVQAASNQVDVNFNVGAGALTNPLVIVSNWTGGLPTAVKFDGATLVQDGDYFPSLRPNTQELWVTLNRTLPAGVHRLEVFPPVPPVAPQNRIVTGADAGGGSHVRGFTQAGDPTNANFLAYPVGFTGGVRVALGDVNGDGIPDIITGAGPGGGPHVQVFDGATGQVLRSFFAYPVGFTGGVYVAAGWVNGDDKADIVTGAGPGGGPHVQVFDGATGAVIHSFFAYSPLFTGGVFVAAGDVNGDGVADIITGAGPGGGPHVQVFDGVTLQVIRSFFAYAPAFTGGVFVAAGDVNGDGKADIITGAGPGGGPHVQVFDGATGQVIRSFFAYSPAFTGGVRVAAADVNGDGKADIITGAGPGGGPHVQVFDGATGNALTGFFAYNPLFVGGVFVAASP